MDYKFVFGVVSVALAVICFIPYYRDILKKKTQPHAYSWLIWTIIQITGAAGQLKGGGGYGAWALLVGAVFCFGIFILSFKYGTKNINQFDLACLISALFAIALYFFVRNPFWSVLVVSITDLAGFLPTYRKGFQEPFTETLITYEISSLANFFSILALQNYTPTTLLYIGSVLFTNTSFFIMIIVRRKLLRRSGSA